MAKKNDIYLDFLKTVEEREKVSQKSRNKRALISLVLIFISIVVFISFSIFSNTSLYSLLFPSIIVNNQNIIIDSLQQKITEQDAKISDLEKSFSKSSNPSFVYLNSKLISIENRNNYLYETILRDPTTAITPILLKKEQENINEKIDDLKKRVDSTNGWLFSILATIVLTLVGFLGKQILGSFFSKKDILKE